MKSRSVLESFSYAIAGLIHAVANERNMRIHVSALVGVVTFATLGPSSREEVGVLACAAGLVLVAEMFNTAIEALVDLESPGLHPLAGAAKNLAAGAVLIAAAVAVIAGTMVAWDQVVLAFRGLIDLVAGRPILPESLRVLASLGVAAAAFLAVLLALSIAAWRRKRI